MQKKLWSLLYLFYLFLLKYVSSEFRRIFFRLEFGKFIFANIFDPIFSLKIPLSWSLVNFFLFGMVRNIEIPNACQQEASALI